MHDSLAMISLPQIKLQSTTVQWQARIYGTLSEMCGNNSLAYALLAMTMRISERAFICYPGGTVPSSHEHYFSIAAPRACALRFKLYARQTAVVYTTQQALSPR
jgi:hypothetical protein